MGRPQRHRCSYTQHQRGDRQGLGAAYSGAELIRRSWRTVSPRRGEYSRRPAISPPCLPAGGDKAGKSLWLLTWNVGGVTAKKLLDLRGSTDLTCADVVLVQEIITEPGLFHDESDHWQLVYWKREGEFRGEAMAHRNHHSSSMTGAVVTAL